MSSPKDPNPDALVFPLSGAKVWSLDNGLEVIVKEDHSAPVVSLQAWCRAGSIHEGDWLGAGMSHFLEHMLFKGTENRSASDVAREVQEKGGYINAYTSYDRTVYWIDCPSTGFEDCLDILCDVVGRATIPKEEFDKEQEVIRREFAMGDDSPSQVVSKMLFENAYATHPCRHPVIGHIDLFNQLSRDDLYQYYREQYSPDNLFLVIAGDVDTEEVRTLIEGHLGGIERRRRSAISLPDEPSQIGQREEVREFPTELSRSRISWQVPDQTHPDMAALDLLAALLGGGRSSRLYQSLREEQQLAMSVSTYAYTPEHRGIFVLAIDAEPENIAAAEKGAAECIERLKSEGVTEDELARVRNQSLSAQFSTLTNMSGVASDLGSNWLSTRNLEYTRDYVSDVQAVTTDDIQRVAQKYLASDAPTTRVALVPKVEEAEKATKKSTQRSEDIRRVVLDNGLTVLLLADHRLPFVQATSAFRGGRLLETAENCGISRLMGRLLTKDTEKRSAQEIANLIESAGGGISATVGNNTVGSAVGALKTDLPLVIDLLGQSILKPAFLKGSIDREKVFQLSALKAEADHPFTIAMNRLGKEIFGEHPYGLPEKGTAKAIAGIGAEDLHDFRSSIVRGGNGVVGVFGDLDLSHAEDLIRAQFEGLASGDRLLQSTEHSLPASYGQIVEETHDKEQAILLIGYRTTDLASEDSDALGLIDEACSDMASRMFIRIREELGLAYSVGSMRMLGLDTGYLAFYVATAPEQLDLVQTEMVDEIAKLASEGLHKDEFERAQASWIGRDVIHLQGVRELATSASIDELVGLGWDHYRSTSDRISKLTRQQVAEVAEKYLTDENRVIVRLTSE